MTQANLPRQAQLAQVLAWQPIDEQQGHMTDDLHEYIAAQLAGQPYRAQFPAIALHLDACVECAELYHQLYLLALAEQQEAAADPLLIPAPDLAFLQPTAPATLLDQVRTAFRRIGERLTLQLTPDLLPVLRPTLATAALRAPADEARYHELLFELTDTQWPLTLRAWRDAQQPDSCLVEVEITLPDRAWPDLADIGVTLIVQDGLHSSVTDAWGLAVFAAVPIIALAALRVEVELESNS